MQSGKHTVSYLMGQPTLANLRQIVAETQKMTGEAKVKIIQSTGQRDAEETQMIVEEGR